jgi:hypothetical protein
LNAPARGNSAGAPGLRMSLIDPAAGAAAAPNLVRSLTPETNAPLGTIEFSRTLTNNTGQAITRIRIRVVDISTYPRPTPTDADLRVLTASSGTVLLSNGATVAVNGATLETPPSQPSGGGLNSSFGIPIPGGTLAPGASINVRFKVGVVEVGNYRFILDVPMTGDHGFVP